MTERECVCAGAGDAMTMRNIERGRERGGETEGEREREIEKR